MIRVDPQVIFVDVAEIDDKMDEFRELLESNQGNKAVKITVLDKNERLNIQSKKFRIPVNKRIYGKLEEIFGEGNVKYIFKNL